MKTLLLIFTFLVMGSASYAQGFNGVHSPDGNYVIAAGDNGLVFRSSNGGTSWEHFNIGSAALTDVFSLGNKYWITSEDGKVFIGNVTLPGVLSARIVENGVSINSVTFVSPADGFVCGDGGKVYKTNDGGNSWTLSNSGISSVNLSSISFLNSNDGVTAGVNGSIFITSDGGSIWTPQASGNVYDLLDVKYFSGGIAAAGKYGALLMKTGAGSFTSVDSRTISDITGISGTDFSNVRLCGGGGFIRNNKSGNSLFLNYEINPMTANLTDIHYTDANTGYAVSSLNKAVIKTVNGGTSWELTGGATVSYQWETKLSSSSGIGNGFYYAPPLYQSPYRRDLIYICHGTKIYRSYDRGENWTQIATVSLGSRAHSFYVSPLDTNLMVASMDASNGRIMRSTDHGQTWTQTWNGNLTSYGMPLEMDPNSPNNLVLGPDNGALLKSTNFGLNWTTLSSVNFVSPCDITIHHGNSNLMFLGDSGPAKLWKSTDGGVNWTLKNSQSTSEVPMIGISQLDTNIAFHTVWGTGGVFRTIDRGENFTNVTTTGSAWGCDIAKDDPTAFAFVTYGRAGYLSLNAGANFTGVTSIGSANAGVLYLEKGEVLAQGTGGVYKLKITYNVNSTPVVVTGLEIVGSSIPDKYSLSQNYPNPFNPSTKIRYQLPENGRVKLTVFDIKGVEVATIINGVQNAGEYSVDFDGSRMTSGVYFYKLETDGLVDTKKMLLIK